MLIHYMSDLHFEHMTGEQTIQFIKYLPYGETVVIAGDICAEHDRLPMCITGIATHFENTIFVLGNHEYYSIDKPLLYSIANKIDKIDGIHWLQKYRPVTINGVTFIGDTMWFSDDPLNSIYRGWMNDFKYIPKFTSWVYDENANTIDRIKQLSNNETIVVSHHAPSTLSISENYKTSNLNRYYYTDMTGLMLSDNAPKLWIHGHMHDPIDYKIGGTRVVANPFGYIHHAETGSFDGNRYCDTNQV